MINKLEKTQKCVENFINKKGYSPTYEEIRQAVGLNSVGAAKHYVNKLVELGRLSKRKGIYSRNIVLVVSSRRAR